MELFSLIEGLEITEKNNLLPLKINIDSKEIIQMLKKGNLHYNALLDDCRLKLRRLGSPSITHCFRERKKVVDAITKLGVGAADYH